MVPDFSWPELWSQLLWPLIRLTFFISVSLFLANLIESLHWTRYAARLAAPLARRARLKDISAAAFSVAFFSGYTANNMLAKAHEEGDISDRELILSNLFNSLPTYFLHLPSTYMIAKPFIGSTATVYVSLTALAALLRTATITLSGRYLLPPIPEGCLPCRLDEMEEKLDRASVLKKTWERFTKRLPKILYITTPIYILLFLAKQFGLFIWLEEAMAGEVGFFSFLPPEALGIVAMQMVAEFSAGLAVASVLIAESSLTGSQVVMALLLGNLLSTPVRSFRHQLPFYAGIFKPGMAMRLIIHNQMLRAFSILVVGSAYAVFIWL